MAGNIMPKPYKFIKFLQKKTLDALGLKKLNSVVEHNATPQILGMVEKVKHLVKVVE